MLGDAPYDIWACGGGYIILIKTFVVHKIIIQGYLKNADKVHVFKKKSVV